MKSILILLLVFAEFNAVHAQQKVNLVANYFPGMMPDEIGLEIGEFDWLYQTWSFVQLPEPLLISELSTDSVAVKLYSFTIVIDDTTCTHINNYRGKIDTLHYFKNSIRMVIATGVQFVDVHTNQHLSHDKNRNSYYFCDDSQSYPKLMLKIENLTKRSCDYSLYYSPSCELPSEKTLLRYGKVRLKKLRKYKSRDY
jgi:hypothetical protein